MWMNRKASGLISAPSWNQNVRPGPRFGSLNANAAGKKMKQMHFGFLLSFSNFALP